MKKTISEATLAKVKASLEANNIQVEIAANADEAREMVEKYIPLESEVMQMTSVTLEQTGIAQLINESGKYNAGRPKLYGEGLSSIEKKRIGNTPEYAIGSVHAITEDGSLVIASNTGSQLGAEAYGAGKVLFVAGYQKIVKNLDEALKRIYDHVLPLESERARKAYGVPGSNVSKILIINKEVNPERMRLILVKEELGY